MDCQSCQGHNPEGARVCLRCGALLPGPPGPEAPRCHLHPEAVAAGPCGRCGTFFCGACLHGVAGQWLCEDCLARQGQLPWDDREALGTWRAWWRTSLRLLGSPGQALAQARPEEPVGSSLQFAVLSTVVGWTPTLILYALFFAATALSGHRGAAGVGPAEGAVAVAAFAAYGLALVLFQVAGVFVLAAFDQLMLMLVGAQPSSYAVSVRANALALAPLVLGLVPGCGVYVFGVWSLVLRVVALAYLHRTDWWRALLAVLIPPLALCCCWGAVFGAISQLR